MTGRIRLVVLSLLSVSAVLCAHAESRVSGAVLDQDGNPLVGVKVTIEGSDAQSVTGPGGGYSIDYKPGEFLLKCEKEGYTWSSIHFNTPDEKVITAPSLTLWLLPPAPGAYAYVDGEFEKIEKNRAIRQLKTETSPAYMYAVEKLTGLELSSRTPTLVIYGGEASVDRMDVSALFVGVGAAGAEEKGRFLGLGERVDAKIARFNSDPSLVAVRFEESLAEGSYAIHWGGLEDKNVETIEAIDFTINTNVPEVVVFDTDFGEVVLGFLHDKAPGHVDNMKDLARQGFYDGTKFHRVIPGFMIQGGCPNTKGDDERTYGTGGPGHNVDAEFNDTKHVRGILSMARSQDPNSAGSQFFICVGAAPFLDGKYTAFGFVVSGMDVVDKIVGVPTKPTGEKSSPVEPVHLKRAYVKELPPEEIRPEKG